MMIDEATEVESLDLDEPSRVGVRVLQGVIIAVIALSLPTGAVAVFGFDAPRGPTADTIGTLFFFAFVLLLSTPWWPLRANLARTRFERVQSMCFLWFGLTFTTHVTWELFWLLLHDPIIHSPDAPWAYLWWMYIDGGDARYAGSDPTLITMEILSVLNGVIGFTGLALWWRSKGRSSAATLLLMATAVVHLYSTAVYFGSELFDGFPNVDTTSIADFWIKFWLLNGLWLVMPWVVLGWGARTLRSQAETMSSEVVEIGRAR